MLRNANSAAYTVRARVLQAHLALSYPLLDWRVLTWEERVHPPEDLPVSADDVGEMSVADPAGEYLFIMAPATLNGKTTGVVVAVEIAKILEHDVRWAGEGIVNAIGKQLVDLIWGEEQEDDDDDDDG
jgi:hypothetical protein